MNKEDFRKKIDHQEQNCWPTVKNFLITFWGNGQEDEIAQRLLVTNYSMRPDYLIRVVKCIDEICKTNQFDADLLHSISWDINVALDNETNEGAREWLFSKFEMLKQVVGE